MILRRYLIYKPLLMSAEVTTLRITNAGVTGYAKNRVSRTFTIRVFRSLEKNHKRAKELLTWIQNAISSGKLENPDKPGAKRLNKYLNLFAQNGRSICNSSAWSQKSSSRYGNRPRSIKTFSR